jgi:hypothetical protein
MRARELPASGYALEVNGKLKAASAIRDGATARRCEKRFSMLQVLTRRPKFARGSQSLNLVFLAFRLGACGKCRTGLS